MIEAALSRASIQLLLFVLERRHKCSSEVLLSIRRLEVF